MPLSFALAVLGCGAATWVDGRPGFPNSLGATPARGWRSWNAYANDVNQTLLERAMAGLARKRGDGGASGASKSLADLGYTDVGLDAGYEMPGHGVDGGCHDAAGHMLINSTRFPSFEAMNAKAHSLGLTSSWYLNSDPCKGANETRLTYVRVVRDCLLRAHVPIRFIQSTLWTTSHVQT